MQKIGTLIIALLAGWPLLSAQPMINAPLMGLQVDVVYLSSDLLEGRETGKEGETMAAQYIARRFQDLGLAPKGAGGSWYQTEEEARQAQTGWKLRSALSKLDFYKTFSEEMMGDPIGFRSISGRSFIDLR